MGNWEIVWSSSVGTIAKKSNKPWFHGIKLFRNFLMFMASGCMMPRVESVSCRRFANVTVSIDRSAGLLRAFWSAEVLFRIIDHRWWTY